MSNALKFVAGVLIGCIGLVNTFWGNDPFFGLFLIALASLFFKPIADRIAVKFGIRLPGFAYVVIFIFALWASLGVGELFDKIQLMIRSFSGE